MPSRFAPARKGFTLVDLLITIAILGVLAAMFFPGLQRYSREPARRTTCLNNVRNLSLACLSYESTNSICPSVVGTNGESFLVRILPMLEHQTLYDDFRAAGRTANAIDELALVELDYLRCPSAASADFNADVNGSFTSHYTGCAGFVTPISATSPAPLVYTMGPGDLGLNGVFSPKLNEDGTLKIGTKNGVDTTLVSDGLSNTMAIIETSRGDFASGKRTFTNARVRWSWGLDPTNQSQVNWGRSVDRKINSFDDTNGMANPFHGIAISSDHAGGANVANGDGSTHFVSEDTDLEILKAAAGINDGIEADLYN